MRGSRLRERVCAAGAAGTLMAAGLVAAPAARAEQPLWELGLGAAALRLPDYRGADHSRNWLLPLPYVVYRGEILRSDRDGARAMLVDGERVEVDLSVAAGAPTDSGASDARRGMPDLEATLEFGPNVNFTLARGAAWKLDLRLPLRAVFTVRSAPRQIGWSTSPNLNFDLRWQGWNFGAQIAALAADRRLNQYTYGVAPAWASAERPAYRAAGGRAGWQGTLSATRREGAFWFGAFVRADTLAGAVFEASPLVRRRDDVAFGIGVAWVFAASTQRVSESR